VSERAVWYNYLVGGLEHFFPYIGNFIIPIDEFHHFSEVLKPPASDRWRTDPTKNEEMGFNGVESATIRRDVCCGFTSKRCDLLLFHPDKWWFKQGYH